MNQKQIFGFHFYRYIEKLGNFAKKVKRIKNIKKHGKC